MNREDLFAFTLESNKIEGIDVVRAGEVEALEALLASDITITDLETYVAAVARGHALRDEPGMNVRVGGHIAPPGGWAIRQELDQLLARARNGLLTPYAAHVEYEMLHPFSDGNGRSGRAVWLWMMLRGTVRERSYARSLGFLHAYYYQSLDAARLPPSSLAHAA